MQYGYLASSASQRNVGTGQFATGFASSQGPSEELNYSASENMGASGFGPTPGSFVQQQTKPQAVIEVGGTNSLAEAFLKRKLTQQRPQAAPVQTAVPENLQST